MELPFGSFGAFPPPGLLSVPFNSTEVRVALCSETCWLREGWGSSHASERLMAGPRGHGACDYGMLLTSPIVIYEHFKIFHTGSCAGRAPQQSVVRASE